MDFYCFITISDLPVFETISFIFNESSLDKNNREFNPAGLIEPAYGKWYLSQRRTAKAPVSLHIRANSSEPSLFAYTIEGLHKEPEICP